MALKKTHALFRAALCGWDDDNKTIPGMALWKARRALHMAWWFIENVQPDDPARTTIFFELRAMVRDATTTAH